MSTIGNTKIKISIKKMILQRRNRADSKISFQNLILGLSIAGNILLVVYLSTLPPKVDDGAGVARSQSVGKLQAGIIIMKGLPQKPGPKGFVGTKGGLRPTQPPSKPDNENTVNAGVRMRTPADVINPVISVSVRTKTGDNVELHPRKEMNEERVFDITLNEVDKQVLNNDHSFPCDDYTPRRFSNTRGTYWVLYNYFIATKKFRCYQSITYTTHGDWTSLDNLVPLLERWQGPISLTLYAPGTDFEESLKRIQYLRECISSNLVKDLVTFHLFFDKTHMPNGKTVLNNLKPPPVNCSAVLDPQSLLAGGHETYRQRNNLSYCVNIGRNVAKEMATTYYVLPCDIELHPTPNLIPEFLEMIRLEYSGKDKPVLKVFVLPHFEVKHTNSTVLPKDKHELIDMIHKKTVTWFHQEICRPCHRIPYAADWLEAPIPPGISAFLITYRVNRVWEPFFIGSKFDPGYDERLTWEGKKDKFLQNYILCLLGYEFHVLDNAFLVHRPGIHQSARKHDTKKERMIAEKKQYSFILQNIIPELNMVYGTRPDDCKLSKPKPRLVR